MPSSINTVFFVDGVFVDYVGNPIPIGIGGEGVTGPTGPTGNSGISSSGSTSISAYQAKKYVKEFWPNGNSTLIIPRSEIVAATILNPVTNLPDPPSEGFVLPYGDYYGPNSPGPTSSGSELCDIHVSLWCFPDGATGWYALPIERTDTYGPPAGTTNLVSIDSTSGDIVIDYKYPSGNMQRIRAIITI